MVPRTIGQVQRNLSIIAICPIFPFPDILCCTIDVSWWEGTTSEAMTGHTCFHLPWHSVLYYWRHLVERDHIWGDDWSHMLPSSLTFCVVLLTSLSGKGPHLRRWLVTHASIFPDILCCTIDVTWWKGTTFEAMTGHTGFIRRSLIYDFLEITSVVK